MDCRIWQRAWWIGTKRQKFRHHKFSMLTVIAAPRGWIPNSISGRTCRSDLTSGIFSDALQLVVHLSLMLCIQPLCPSCLLVCLNGILKILKGVTFIFFSIYFLFFVVLWLRGTLRVVSDTVPVRTVCFSPLGYVLQSKQSSAVGACGVYRRMMLPFISARWS